MFQLIADSGSTKTDWYLLLNENVVLQCKTKGCNPFAVSREWIQEELKNNLFPKLEKHLSVQKLDYLHFYGAGCNKGEGQHLMEETLGQLFSSYTQIAVHSDLLAAARALCGKDSGICVIMGTGSNVCWYDGKDILVDLPSLGYFLGDEGGGCDLGKRLVQGYFRQLMPKELRQQFEQNYNINYSNYLENIYKRPAPNAYLANFAPFCVQNKANIFIKNIIDASFGAFFGQQINHYKQYASQYNLYCLGSIAVHLKEELTIIANKHNFITKEIIQSPFPRLIDYHKKYR